jgi:hypothetical protein
MTITIHKNKIVGMKWWKPWTMAFLKSAVRKAMSGYWNYRRLIWLGLDITIQY